MYVYTHYIHTFIVFVFIYETIFIILGVLPYKKIAALWQTSLLQPEIYLGSPTYWSEPSKEH
jgi:hypothetical protein